MTEVIYNILSLKKFWPVLAMFSNKPKNVLGPSLKGLNNSVRFTAFLYETTFVTSWYIPAHENPFWKGFYIFRLEVFRRESNMLIDFLPKIVSKAVYTWRPKKDLCQQCLPKSDTIERYKV